MERQKYYFEVVEDNYTEYDILGEKYIYPYFMICMYKKGIFGIKYDKNLLEIKADVEGTSPHVVVKRFPFGCGISTILATHYETSEDAEKVITEMETNPENYRLSVL